MPGIPDNHSGASQLLHFLSALCITQTIVKISLGQAFFKVVWHPKVPWKLLGLCGFEFPGDSVSLSAPTVTFLSSPCWRQFWEGYFFCRWYTGCHKSKPKCLQPVGVKRNHWIGVVMAHSRVLGCPLSMLGCGEGRQRHLDIKQSDGPAFCVI